MRQFLISAAAGLVGLAFVAPARADDDDGYKKYWKHQRESEKRLEKLWREQQKRSEELFHEQRQREAAIYREQQKRAEYYRRDQERRYEALYRERHQPAWGVNPGWGNGYNSGGQWFYPTTPPSGWPGYSPYGSQYGLGQHSYQYQPQYYSPGLGSSTFYRYGLNYPPAYQLRPATPIIPSPYHYVPRDRDDDDDDD